jgi:hypothetical protein
MFGIIDDIVLKIQSLEIIVQNNGTKWVMGGFA